MNCAKDARRLADFVTSLEGSLCTADSSSYLVYDHIGALFVDIILQAGLNYKSVVQPRVKALLTRFPNDKSRTAFQGLIDQYGLSTLIDWRDHVKLTRIESLLNHAKIKNVDTCHDLISHLSYHSNRTELLEIKGIGPKTVDYLLKLLGYDTVAVDRHIYSFIKMAQIDASDYQRTKRIVEYAADFLNVPRASLDYGIWNYMSKLNLHQNKIEVSQLNLPF